VIRTWHNDCFIESNTLNEGDADEYKRRIHTERRWLEWASPKKMKLRRSTIMGDKGGKKNKQKNEKQNSVKHDQKEQLKLEKQQKDNPLPVLPGK
jgi:hypothetical protein